MEMSIGRLKTTVEVAGYTVVLQGLHMLGPVYVTPQPWHTVGNREIRPGEPGREPTAAFQAIYGPDYILLLTFKNLTEAGEAHETISRALAEFAEGLSDMIMFNQAGAPGRGRAH